MLPGRKSSFRAGFRQDSNRETLKNGPPAGRRQAFGPILKIIRLESIRNPIRKPDFRRGSICVKTSVFARGVLQCWGLSSPKVELRSQRPLDTLRSRVGRPSANSREHLSVRLDACRMHDFGHNIRQWGNPINNLIWGRGDPSNNRISFLFNGLLRPQSLLFTGFPRYRMLWVARDKRVPGLSIGPQNGFFLPRLPTSGPGRGEVPPRGREFPHISRLIFSRAQAGR